MQGGRDVIDRRHDRLNAGKPVRCDEVRLINYAGDGGWGDLGPEGNIGNEHGWG